MSSLLKIGRKTQSKGSGFKVGYKRSTNKEYRTREYLTPDEVRLLIDAARNNGRNRLRNAALLTAMYHHAMRLTEALNLRWANINFQHNHVDFNRLKGSKDAHHDLNPTLRKMLLKMKKDSNHEYIFITESGLPMKASNVQTMVKKRGELAGLDIKVHPHMLRHAMGYYLINKDGACLRTIQNYLGHAEIKHTVAYTAVDEKKSRGLLKDLPF